MSGAVNPDQYDVDMAGGAIVKRTLGDRRVEIHAVPGGGTQRTQRSRNESPGTRKAPGMQLFNRVLVTGRSRSWPNLAAWWRDTMELHRTPSGPWIPTENCG